ncbi:adenosylcobinamide-GDP ribazoletransferase [Simiduia litorea]|uniref:adenosylcobinamide-GDP ribazoletransferase n=1 Tax=Simiduia litorea TaxID=1435348 RepID=UPI0036F370E5
MITSFWLALMFLTRIPAPVLDTVTDRDQGRALMFFPVIGLLIGMVLAAILFLLPTAMPLVSAALLLMVWVFITGGLHIDGLADAADAWLGGLGDKERTLEIMKDPRAGSAAIMAVVCVLLVKFAALATFDRLDCVLAVIVTPIIGRCVPALLFFSTPYARDFGLASPMLHNAEPRLCLLVLGGLLLLVSGALFSLLAWYVVVFWLLLAAVLWALRRLMLARIDGVTGDTVGASVEIIEMSALVLMLLLMS